MVVGSHPLPDKHLAPFAPRVPLALEDPHLVVIALLVLSVVQGRRRVPLARLVRSIISQAHLVAPNVPLELQVLVGRRHVRLVRRERTHSRVAVPVQHAELEHILQIQVQHPWLLV